ncbi:MAG: SDR family oxidoreductase, partial [Candidatus Magasanikbacteria bacterium]|nr:SDR family oxidoreductase [Candidatus Magasanikbacteria bacterium]
MDLELTGKRVLVTGGSQGIGKAIALSFAKEGANVSVISRREDVLQQVCTQMGEGHSYFVGDLLEAGVPLNAVQVLEKEGGPFDIVVHNVGGPLEHRSALSSIEAWQKVWQFNVGIAIEMNNH